MAAIAMETEEKGFKFYQNLLCRYFLNLMEIILATMALVYAKKSPSYWQLVQLLLWKQKKGGGDLNNFNMYSMQWFRQMFYLTDTSSSHLVSFGRLLWSLDHRVLITSDFRVLSFDNWLFIQAIRGHFDILTHDFWLQTIDFCLLTFDF